MRGLHVNRTRVFRLAGAALFVAAVASLGAVNTWRVDRPDVRVTCPLTVGGSFQARTAALSGSLTVALDGSSSFDGSLTLDLRTLDTGISLRNEHLRDNYLEVGKGPGYDRATLTDIQLKGLAPDATEGKGTFSGTLTLHGVRRPLAGQVELKTTGTSTRVKASFPLSLSDYEIPEPRYLGVGVRDRISVEVTFAVAPAAEPTSQRPIDAGSIALAQ